MAAVVHHQRTASRNVRPRAAREKLQQQPLHIGASLPTFPAFQIKFKIAIATGHSRDPRNRLLAQGRSSKIGLQNHPRRVDHGAKGMTPALAHLRLNQFRKLIQSALKHGLGQTSVPYFLPHPKDHRSHAVANQSPRIAGKQIPQFWPVEILPDLRQPAIHAFDARLFCRLMAHGLDSFFSVPNDLRRAVHHLADHGCSISRVAKFADQQVRVRRWKCDQ